MARNSTQYRGAPPDRSPIRALPALTLIALAACRPPASDEYVERVGLAERRAGPTVLLEDPDTSRARWAAMEGGERLLFGVPGEAPLLALECRDGGTAQALLRLTRYERADPKASALIAIIGNSHIARLPIEAVWNGRAWLWQADWRLAETDLAALTGTRAIEATIPGAGSLQIAGSRLPGLLVRRCEGAPPAPLEPEA